MPRRSRYHHGDLVAQLVRVATDFVDRDGHEALSVRELARSLGVSPGAPFRHFRDRDDLLRAVAHEARLRLAALAHEAIEAAADDDPLTRFRAIGFAQVRFAIRHPNLQRLAQLPTMRAPPSTATEAELATIRSMGSGARSLVVEAQARGSMRAGDPAVLALAGVALVHGLTQLFLDGDLPREGAEQLADSVIEVLGSGFARDASAQAASRPTR